MERSEKRSFQKKRGCRFCMEPDLLMDYKDRHLMYSYVTERYKIVPRRISGMCAAHQRSLATAIKRARHLAILAYSPAQF